MAPYVFNYNISDVSKSAIALQRGRINAVGPEALKKLWERMKGK
jgi:hypothetical protein